MRLILILFVSILWMGCSSDGGDATDDGGDTGDTTTGGDLDTVGGEPDADECVPDCGPKDCGPDGCGGECGVCEEWMGCVDGICQHAALPTFTAAQEVLQKHCSPCHEGASPGTCQGEACLVSHIEDHFLSANSCFGSNKGECSILRIKDGTMPPGADTAPSIPEDDLELLEAWVAGGMQE